MHGAHGNRRGPQQRRTSQVGISLKSVEKFFKKMDLSGDGSISEEEFIKVVLKMIEALRADEEILAKGAPPNYVIPGSCKMNARSGTTAFRSKVVRRKSMRRLFDLFNDVNLDGDGSITLMEFRKHIQITRPELTGMAASIFYSLDNVSLGMLCQGYRVTLMSLTDPHARSRTQRRLGKVSFKRLLERMFPEATPKDIKVLLMMSRPKDYLPKTKPNQEVRGADNCECRSSPGCQLLSPQFHTFKMHIEIL